MAEIQEAAITQDERTMAVLAHALQVVGWWIAPLVILLLQRKSRFVSFHALQALLLQIVYMVLSAGFIVLWIGAILFTIARQHGDKAAHPTAFFILMPLIWLGFMVLWVSLLVITIIYAIKAGRGEWSNYPLLGRVARRILKMEQEQGTPTNTGT
jgi:uncharacterized membrane protein